MSFHWFDSSIICILTKCHTGSDKTQIKDDDREVRQKEVEGDLVGVRGCTRKESSKVRKRVQGKDREGPFKDEIKVLG